MKARGGAIYPLTILFITWKKSLNFFNLNESNAASTRLLSLRSLERFYSSYKTPNFSSFNLNSSAAVLSYQTFIFESLPPVTIIKLGL